MLCSCQVRAGYASEMDAAPPPALDPTRFACRTPCRASAAASGCPQRKGVVLKVVETSPRKPNSGKRRVAWLRISMGRQTPGSRRKKYKRIRAHIPGIGNHNLQTHSQVAAPPPPPTTRARPCW